MERTVYSISGSYLQHACTTPARQYFQDLQLHKNTNNYHMHEEFYLVLHVLPELGSVLQITPR